MNLHSRKARIPIAALGVTALCTTGLGVVAGSAFAATSLTITPTTTSVNALDVGAAITPGSTAPFGTFAAGAPGTALAKATYGLRVTSVNPNLALSLDSYTAPGGTAPSVQAAALWFQQDATDSPTTTSVTPALNNWTSVDASATASTSAALSPTTSATSSPSYVYLAPDQPGTYKVRLIDTQGTTATDDDVATPVITLSVKDVEGATSTATDDWAPSVTNSVSTTGVGAPITTTVGLSSLTLTDGRGSSSGKGVLGDAIAALTGVSFAGAGAPGSYATYVPVINPDGTRLLPVGATTDSTLSPLVATARFDTNGDGTFVGSVAVDYVALGFASTIVTTNNVTTVTGLAPTTVVGSISSPSASTASIKPGTSTVTYTAVAKDSASAVVAGATVYFTLTPGASTTGLTADGTLVSSTTSSGVKIYSATTDSSGVATLKVTSDTTTAGISYQVNAASNGHGSSAPTAVTATYSAPAVTATLGSLISQNTSAELNPVAAAGVSVVLKGKALDQYGAPFSPASNAVQTVAVSVNSVVVCNAVIASDGTFSCTYTPTTAPTSGSSVPYTFTYSNSTTATFSGTINFASSSAAATVTLSTPANNGTATVDKASSTLGSQPGVAVVGKVLDASNVALAYKQVTLTGTGVKFSTSGAPTAGSTTDDLVDSLTTTTDSSGNITGAYVYYLGTGTDTVKATVGTVSATSSVTVAAPTTPDPYKVTVNDVSGNPGSTLIITGSVVDGFGNPAPGAKVLLGTGTSTLGSFGNSTPITNTLGIYSTTFITGSNQSGTADLTATLYNGAGTVLLTSATNPKPDASFLTAGGLTIPAGEYTDQAKITLSSQEVTISTTGSLVGGGKAQLSGNAAPNSSVEIWSKPSGATGFSLVGTRPVDADGTWGVGTTLTKTTAFFVKNGATVSPTVATVVYSYETLKAKALGSGKVEFKVYGVPNVKGYVNIYYGSKRLAHVASDSHGDATVTVQSSKGRKTFTVYFVAPGTSLKGKDLTGTVK